MYVWQEYHSVIFQPQITRIFSFVILNEVKNLLPTFANGRCFTDVQHDRMTGLLYFDTPSR